MYAISPCDNPSKKRRRTRDNQIDLLSYKQTTSQSLASLRDVATPFHIMHTFSPVLEHPSAP